MINVIIVEDEEPAAERLAAMLQKVDGIINILDTIVSVKSAVKRLVEDPKPDLIFMDINLADGNSFQIFKSVNITAPVIFITAFDQFAVEAFKVNSVDYLLKPIKREDLENAINKFKSIYVKSTGAPMDYTKLMDMLNSDKREYQKRILIRYADNIKAIEIDNAAYFYTEEKFNFLVTYDKASYPIDYNLDELEDILDPRQFFRINRQFIVNYKAIDKMVAWTKSRVKVHLNPPSHIETIVSTERSPIFKEWLLGK